MKSSLRPALTLFLFLTILTGVVYPLIVTAFARTFASHRANGSMIVRDGVLVGSELIGQSFDDPRYFWSRPSATGLVGYNAGASSGSNLGPTNPALIEAVSLRVKALRDTSADSMRPIPVDLVTASASGLDPHISPSAARFQVQRVARARNLPVERVRGVVDLNVESRTLGVLGEPRVNVLKLNLTLDALGR